MGGYVVRVTWRYLGGASQLWASLRAPSPPPHDGSPVWILFFVPSFYLARCSWHLSSRVGVGYYISVPTFYAIRRQATSALLSWIGCFVPSAFFPSTLLTGLSMYLRVSPRGTNILRFHYNLTVDGLIIATVYFVLFIRGENRIATRWPYSLSIYQ